jgi:hypothetical protein
MDRTRPSLLKWFKRLISGQPHFKIGGESPYLLRWFLIPRNGWMNIYLHKFLRDDDDRALHDHPWWFVSFMLKGAYLETTPHPNSEYGTQTKVRSAPSVAYRPAAARHRVTLFKNQDGSAKPCWTIVITGRKAREWGFWCPKGFVPWSEFVEPTDEGNIGKGCGE